MTHWDGLVSSSSTGMPQRILILGATNRINDIDEAILRRMPKKFAVPLPTAPQRRNIFTLVLKGTKIDEPNFDIKYLVKLSAGLSGSDIKEACRDAAMMPMREVIKERSRTGSLKKGIRTDEIRGLRTEDFFRKERMDPRVGARAMPDEVTRAVVEELDEEDDEEGAWSDASSQRDAKKDEQRIA